MRGRLDGRSGFGLLADVGVGVGEGAVEEGRPEIVEGIAGGHGEDALALEAAGGGVHLEREGEADFADRGEAAGDVGVFAVEGDAGVEAADGFERGAAGDEVAALHHGTDAEEIAVDGVGGPGGDVENVYEETLAGREVVVENGAGESGEGEGPGGVGFGFGEGGEDVGEPVGGEAGVGVDVGDEGAGAGGKSGLAGEGESFARLVDEDDAGIGEGDVAGAVGAGVVDDDDLHGAGGEGAGLGEDGVEAGGEIGLFVVRGHDEAYAHDATVQRLCCRKRNFEAKCRRRNVWGYGRLMRSRARALHRSGADTEERSRSGILNAQEYFAGGSLQLVRRFRLPAVFCALAVLVCELVSRPYAEMGICDDGPYILMAQKLAVTGHFAYNGWSAPMLGWQVYFAAVFIKLFGYSFTTVRMSTLLVAMALAFVLQRTMVRANISERNATIGTLALVLSPLYLMLSATFMSDIQGLFAIAICLYGCLRALQSSTSRATFGWLCFAIFTNALFGTARQIAWLGLLVIVPSTLWLLRTRRRVFFWGAVANLAGTLFILACMHWIRQQPYSIPEHLLPSALPLVDTFRNLIYFFLDVPFLLLPVVALFIQELRKSSLRVLVALCLGYFLVVVHPRHTQDMFLLEPTVGQWVNVYGIYDAGGIKGFPPLFLHRGMQILLTIVSIGGLLGLMASTLRNRRTPAAAGSLTGVSWKVLGILLAPFTLAYTLLLIPRAIGGLYDRYALALLLVALLCSIRYYQERIESRLPLASIVLVGIMAIYGVAVTHNIFALYRARVAIAAELRADGVPDTSVDNAWEYNFNVELQHADFLNESKIVVPAHAYVPTPPLPAGTCHMWAYDQTPHIRPLYGVSFDPNECYGPAPFAPVTYSRWLASTPGSLFVVRYTPPSTR